MSLSATATTGSGDTFRFRDARQRKRNTTEATKGDARLFGSGQRPSAQVAVDDILQHLLAARDVRGGVALVQHVLLQRLEVGLAALDLLAHARVPRAVALLDEVLQHAVLAHPGGDLQAV